MVTKLEKKVVMPISSPAFSISGREAANPAEATNPGRIRSAAVSDAPDALSPRPANDWNTISARPLEVAEQQGEKADVEHLADQLRRHVVLAHQRPEQAGQRDVDRHQDGGQERHVTRQETETAVDVAAEGLGEAVDDG